KFALALTIAVQGREQVLPPKIGPERRGGIVLAVGGLPQEEIADAHLTRRSNDQIGIWQISGIEIRGQQLFGDSLRAMPICDDLPDGIHQFGPSTVVKAYVQANTSIVTGQLDRVPNGLLNIRGEIL